MKIACNKCLKIKDIDLGFPEKWSRIKTEYSEYILCDKCMDGFWQAIDSNYPPVILNERIEESEARE